MSQSSKLHTLLLIALGWSLCTVAATSEAKNKAKAPAAAAPAKPAARERVISREAKQSKDSSKIDFDAIGIAGERKTPSIGYITQTRADKENDFIKIRKRWTPEMIQSANNLDNGSR